MLNNTFKKGIFSISKSNIAKLSNRFNSAFSNQLFQIPAKHISTYTFNSEKVRTKLKSQETFSQKYYEEMLEILPQNKNGVVQLQKSIFNKALNDASNESDIEFLLNVIADYMGHYTPLSSNNLDDYLSKAIELKCPNKLISLLKNHRQLLYYPDPSLIEDVFKLYNGGDWAAMKEFYLAIGRKYYIKKTDLVYEIFIENAYKNNDMDMCVEAFLDILDYEKVELSMETYKQIIYSNKGFVSDRIFVELLKVFEGAQLSFEVALAMVIYSFRQEKIGKINYYLDILEKTQGSIEESVNMEVGFVAEFVSDIKSNKSNFDGESDMVEALERIRRVLNIKVAEMESVSESESESKTEENIDSNANETESEKAESKADKVEDSK